MRSIRQTLASAFVAGALMYSLPSHALPSLTVTQDDPRLKPASVRVIEAEGYKQIAIDGYIHAATVEQFKAVADLSGMHSGIIYFNSAGGDLLAAIDLGRLIRQSNYSTRVVKIDRETGKMAPAICESACPLAYAGGRFRLLDDDAKLGIHRFYRAASGSWAETARMTTEAYKRLDAYLAEMGMHPELAEMIRKIPSDRMRHLPPNEAHVLRLVNNGVEPAVWKSQDRTVQGSQATSFGSTQVKLSCSIGEAGPVAADFAVRPWHNPAALLAFDTHSFLTSTHPYPIAEAKVGFRRDDGYLTIRTHLTSAMITAAASASSIGYGFSQTNTQDSKRFEIEALQGQQMITNLARECGVSIPASGTDKPTTKGQ